MVRYFAKRLGMMFIALFLILLLTFTLMHSRRPLYQRPQGE